MMTSGEKFVDKFMRVTDKFQKVFGPAEQGDINSPVVHRHDEFEDESDLEISQVEQRTDSEGHHYAVRKSDEEESQA